MTVTQAHIGKVLRYVRSGLHSTFLVKVLSVDTASMRGAWKEQNNGSGLKRDALFFDGFVLQDNERWKIFETQLTELPK